MQEIYRTIARLTTTDLTVMINGESGTGKELVARALHDYGRRRGGAVRRDQHGGDPARADRERAVRPRARRLHRRDQPQPGPLRAGRPAARCSSTRSATCRPRRRRGCCACCRRASSPRVGGRQSIRANVRIIAATHRDLRHGDPARAVPRGSVLSPERGADPPAAAARADRGHRRAGAALPRARRMRTGWPAKSLDAGGARRGCGRIAGRATCASWRT